ncbi:MAG: hypothetical protein K8S97_06750 [Anaerolineae bacterium]|nr:hypothetical protein [Anaerolineae bacterium]
MLVVLALLWGGITDSDSKNAASQADYGAAAAGESVALNPTTEALNVDRTATADALTWTARTAIAFEGEGLQITIEAQTYYYATNEALALTGTAESWRMTATPQMLATIQPPPAIGLVEDGEAGGGTGYDEADADAGMDDALGASAAPGDGDTVGIEEAEADFADPATLEDAPDAAFEEEFAYLETSPAPPMPAAIEGEAGDPDVFEVMPAQADPGSNAASGIDDPPPAADAMAQPQAPAEVTVLPTPAITPTNTAADQQAVEAESAAGMMQPTTGDDAALELDAADTDEPSAQAQREHEDDEDTADDAEAPTDGEYDEAAPETTTGGPTTSNTMQHTATPLALVPTEVEEGAAVATAQAQDIAAEPATADQPELRVDKTAQADDDNTAAWLVRLAIVLFIASIAILLLGRRKANHS